MKMQTHANACGPATVANVLRALGRATNESVVSRKLENQRALYGTTEARIMLGLEKMGYRYSELRLTDEAAAWALLRMGLLSGQPTILSIDADEHWIGAIGMLGDRVLVADSANDEIVLSWDRAELCQRWGSAVDDKAVMMRYYGITLVGRGRRA